MLKQTISQKLLQKMSPQQIQLMKLLQVPTMELEQRIKQEIEENPALDEGKEDDYEKDSDIETDYDDNNEMSDSEKEFDINDYLDDDIPQYKTSVKNQGADDEEKVMPFSAEKSFTEFLMQQLSLRNLDEREQRIAVNIIGNLDDDGYLRRDLIDIVDDLAFSQNISTDEAELENLLSHIQDLDPPGVGARDLRECLLIQLNKKESGSISIYTAKVILEKHFEDFSKKHYDKILKKLDLDDSDLKEAIEVIIKLNPKPGGALKDSVKNMQQVIPDFVITERDHKLELTLNSRNAPQLKINRDYENLLRSYAEGSKHSKSDKEALTFVRQKIDSAKWFIDAIKQRQNTLLLTMQAIMEYQYDYFLTGDETKLRPMILKDIAEIVHLDISTISRVANSKYVQTPYGIFQLKYFFSESLSTESGEEVSTREVKKILQDAVEGENKRKPLTDERLAVLLKEKGYNIARRTVAKYREQLNIPVARLRKEL